MIIVGLSSKGSFPISNSQQVIGGHGFSFQDRYYLFLPQVNYPIPFQAAVGELLGRCYISLPPPFGGYSYSRLISGQRCRGNGGVKPIIFKWAIQKGTSLVAQKIHLVITGVALVRVLKKPLVVVTCGLIKTGRSFL